MIKTERNEIAARAVHSDFGVKESGGLTRKNTVVQRIARDIEPKRIVPPGSEQWEERNCKWDEEEGEG